MSLNLKTCLHRSFFAAAVLWPTALLLATIEASRPHSSTTMAALDVLALAVYGAGSIVCHQLTERSFQLWSTQLPVCARCTGIYAGAGLAALLPVMSGVAESLKKSMFAAAKLPARGRGVFTGGPPSPRTGAATGVEPHIVRRTLLVAALPTLATLVVEWSTIDMPANWVRAAAAVPLGAAVVWVIGSLRT